MTAKVITQLVFRHKRVLTMALRKNLKSNCNRGRPKFGLYTLRQVRSQMRFQVFQTQHACLSSTGRFISLSLFFFLVSKERGGLLKQHGCPLCSQAQSRSCPQNKTLSLNTRLNTCTCNYNPNGASSRGPRTERSSAILFPPPEENVIS